MIAASPVHPGVAEKIIRSPDPDVANLPAVLTDDEVITRWELSDDDRARLAAGGSMYLRIMTFGRPLQPVCLTTECPFVEEGQTS